MNRGRPLTPAEARAYALLVEDPSTEKLICKILRVNGMPAQDIEDGRQDVYVKVLVAIQDGAAPADLDEMAALCAKIAYRHAMSVLRKLTVRAHDMVAGCEPDELAPLNARVEQRDAIDAGRQLEILARLFREGKLPPDGVDILEGVACGCSHEEIALGLRTEAESPERKPDDVPVNANLVAWRLHRMRKVYRRELVKLGLVSNVTPLKVLVSAPGAIETLRNAS